MRLPAIPPTPTILFDLDGTLVHTVPDIAAALDIALGSHNVAPTSAAEAATMMGDGLSEFFWRSLVAKRLSLPAREADAARKQFIKVYSQSPARLAEVYPGIRELLQELRGLFDAIVGSRDDRPMKPDPRPLVEAVARAGGRIERTLLVGDTGADNGAAIAARIPVVLVDYGYSHIPISALTYGTIVDNAESMRAAVMAFVNMEQILGPDTDLPHGRAA